MGDSPVLSGPPASRASWATDTLTRLVLTGALTPGERLREEVLAEQLGISRPPTREALQALTAAGLLEHRPRRGTRVRSLTQNDVYEIVTMRQELERFAMALTLPDIDAGRWANCLDRLQVMRQAAHAENFTDMMLASFEFHVSIVALSGHSRVEQAYRRMAMQLQMCMSMNIQARLSVESLHGNVQRHERLLSVIATRDPDKVQTELANHGDRTFLLQAVDGLPGATSRSRRWLTQLREQENAALT